MVGPDGDVYYGRGSVVYVVRGDHAPVAVLHAAGPVLAVAANASDLFVEVKATVREYRRSNGRMLRGWSLPSPFPVTMAGLYAIGGTVWAWTDWATDASGNIFETGFFRNIVDFGPGPFKSGGGYDIFLLKLDPDGGLLFAKHFGEDGDQFSNGVAVGEEVGNEKANPFATVGP